MSNEAEDFATFVEAFIELPENELLAEIGSNNLLKQKYEKVHDHYLKLGIDLHAVQRIVDTELNNIFGP